MVSLNKQVTFFEFRETVVREVSSGGWLLVVIQGIFLIVLLDQLDVLKLIFLVVDSIHEQFIELLGFSLDFLEQLRV